jgi:hypothetical protein
MENGAFRFDLSHIMQVQEVLSSEAIGEILKTWKLSH